MEEEKKKTNFLFVFSTYLPVILLKFRSRELVGCKIKFRIQWVPTWHIFDRPRYPKNKNIITFFQVLFLGLQGPSKVCRVGTRSHPMSSLDRNLSKITGRYVENTNKKVVFFFSSSKINKYYFIILTIFY